VGFLGGCTQKNPPGFFSVCTRVSELWSAICFRLPVCTFRLCEVSSSITPQIFIMKSYSKYKRPGQ